MTSADEMIQEDLELIRKNLEDELSELKNSKILITGGAGFLGYYLVLFLDYLNSLNHNIEITIFDNFQRGVPLWLTNLEVNQRVIVINQDMVEPLPDNMPLFDYIIHAASIASPIFYRKHPIETMDANIIGLRNLLQYSVDRKQADKPIKSLLFFSSSEVYGDPDPKFIPTSEDYNGNVSFTGPRACYDESKRFGETLCVNYAKEFQLPIKIARPFNNYGPGLKINDTRALPDFAKNVLEGNDIVLFSDGSPTRTFCYITDAITGYFKVMIKGSDGRPYNIGIDGPEISIKKLAEITVDHAKELFNYDGSLVFANSDDEYYLTDNPDRRCPDISRARSELNYEPNIDVFDGVKRSLIWYSDNSKGASEE